MNEGELWIRILETIGRRALDCAAEIRTLVGEMAATRPDEDGPADHDG